MNNLVKLPYIVLSCKKKVRRINVNENSQSLIYLFIRIIFVAIGALFLRAGFWEWEFIYFGYIIAGIFFK